MRVFKLTRTSPSGDKEARTVVSPSGVIEFLLGYCSDLELMEALDMCEYGDEDSVMERETFTLKIQEEE